MPTIINVKELDGGIDRGIAYIHSKWGNETNYSFYEDAITNSSLPGKKLPKFFLMINDGIIIGCCGLITNDFISRHDFYPWLACLFIEENQRKKGYAGLLMNAIESVAQTDGFETLYLTTQLDGYYEKYDWVRMEDGITFDGTPARIYRKAL
ncbi:MAG TPA: GNAT family N-acetyltransferase [Spirochaetota bacterium]